MRTKRFLNLVTCCLVLVGTAMGQSASSGGTIAIRNARLVTVSGATIERGTLVAGRYHCQLIDPASGLQRSLGQVIAQ